jgi:hypothetical protein
MDARREHRGTLLQHLREHEVRDPEVDEDAARVDERGDERGRRARRIASSCGSIESSPIPSAGRSGIGSGTPSSGEAIALPLRDREAS